MAPHRALIAASLALGVLAGAASPSCADGTDGTPAGAVVFHGLVRSGGVAFSGVIVDRLEPPRWTVGWRRPVPFAVDLRWGWRPSSAGPGGEARPRSIRGLGGVQIPPTSGPAQGAGDSLRRRAEGPMEGR